MSSLTYDCPLLLTTLTALGEIALLAPTLFETQRPAIVRDFIVKELLMKDRVISKCLVSCVAVRCLRLWRGSGKGWDAKAQEDEKELKAREGGELSLNSFRSPLQAGDVKSNCNLPGLRVTRRLDYE